MYRVCICDACGNRSLKEILGVNREDRGGGDGADNSTGRDKVAHTGSLLKHTNANLVVLIKLTSSLFLERS